MNSSPATRSTYPTLGIIGGAGPMVAAKLAVRALEAVRRITGARLDHEFPGIVSINCAIEGVGPLGVEDRCRAALGLARAGSRAVVAGADVLLVACASLHALLEGEDGLSMGAPIGHWVDRQAQRIAREHKVVGVISSRSAKESGVHAKAFDKEGSSAITLDDVSQLDADALILELMGGDAANSGARLNALGLSLIARGATAVWWGCTELGGSEDIKVSYPVFEPMDGMVEQALHLWGLAE